MEVLSKAPAGGPQPAPPCPGTHRGCRRSKGQAEEHEQWDELFTCLHVGHGQRAVIALEAHLRWLEEVGQLQEVEGHDGGCHYGQLQEERWPGSHHTHSLSESSTHKFSPVTDLSTHPCCSPTDQLIHQLSHPPPICASNRAIRAPKINSSIH